MESEIFREWIKEAKERNSDDEAIMNVLDEMTADPCLDSIIEGYLLTTSLCMGWSPCDC